MEEGGFFCRRPTGATERNKANDRRETALLPVISLGLFIFYCNIILVLVVLFSPLGNIKTKALYVLSK